MTANRRKTYLLGFIATAYHVDGGKTQINIRGRQNIDVVTWCCFTLI